MLKGKTVLPGAIGSIAAYKITSLIGILVKQGVEVRVLMTKNTTSFISPITFKSPTGNKCLAGTFDRNFESSVEHVTPTKRTDVVVATPASANVIDKVAHGIAGDMLTTTIMAYRCRKIMAPAMNTDMYKNPILQNNLETCHEYGMGVIGPACGCLACGDIEAGKVPEPEVLYQYILREAGHPKDLAGKKILVTTGPTREAMGPMRYITNHSIGKMGYAIARIVAYRGAQVILVGDPVDMVPPLSADVVAVKSARQMFETVTSRSRERDIIIKAAAVADYKPTSTGTEKIRKKGSDLSIVLERTDGVPDWLGNHRRGGQFLCGFSMETQNILEDPRTRLKKKHIDMIVADNLKVEDTGFGTDTNLVTIITEKMEKGFPMMSKGEVADPLLSKICG